MGETQAKEKAYKTKNKKIKMWGNLLNQQKIAFFNVIKMKKQQKSTMNSRKRTKYSSIEPPPPK